MISETASTSTFVVSVLPVITLVLGWVMNSVTEFYRERRALRRERESRGSSLRIQLAERRTEFQRQTLLELQDAVFDVMRRTGAMHHQDEMAYRKTGEWQKQLYGEELDQKATVAMRVLAKFNVRVRDDSLRELAWELRNLAAKVTVSISREHSNASLQEMVDIFEKVQLRTGELVRTLDDYADKLFSS